MTAREALQQGDLDESLKLQSAQVEAEPDDAAARLFLVELLTLAGRLQRAREELFQIESPSLDWPRSRLHFLMILKAQSRRRRAAPILAGHLPAHATLRRKVWRQFRRGNFHRLEARIDRANQQSPYLVGHVDGREFEGLRDLDDRFASVLEVFSGADYTWIPLEHLRKIVLRPVVGVLDTIFRPAQLLIGQQVHDVILPLVYPESHQAEADFALGLDTDCTAEQGLIQAVGAKICMIGDEEIPLAECQQFELRQP